MMRGLPLGLCALMTMIGCDAPDYAPVRSWATVASRATDYPAAAVTRATPAGADLALHPVADDSILAMQEALGTYLLAIGTMASDGVLPYREDPFVALAARAARGDAVRGRIVTPLGILLRDAGRNNAQAPQLRDTIRASDGLIQALVVTLTAAVATPPEAEAEARAEVARFYAGLESTARDPATRQSIRDWAALRDQEFAARAAGREQYAAILTRIGEGHAMLKANAAHITEIDAVQRIRGAEGELRRATAALPRQTALP